MMLIKIVRMIVFTNIVLYIFFKTVYAFMFSVQQSHPLPILLLNPKPSTLMLNPSVLHFVLNFPPNSLQFSWENSLLTSVLNDKILQRPFLNCGATFFFPPFFHFNKHFLNKIPFF